MGKGPFITKFSILYAVMLFLSVYFVHDYVGGGDSPTIHLLGQEHTIGLLFLAWASAARDLVQLSGVRYRGILVLLVVCGATFFMFDSEAAAKASVALIWTELIDFAVFTSLWRSTRSIFAMVVSDLISVPMLWYILFLLLDSPIENLPPNTMTVQYLALTVLYLVIGVVCLRSERWREFLGVRKAS